MPYGYGSASSGSGSSSSGPGPGGQGARGQATQNPGKGGGWSPGVGGKQHQPKTKTTTSTWTPGGGAPTHIPKKKTSTWTPGAGAPTHIPKKKTTPVTTGITGSNKFKKFLANINFRHGKGIRDLKNYSSIIGTYFGGMLPGKLGDWATGMMRTDEMDENLANLINQKMTTGFGEDKISGNISYGDYGLPQSYDLIPPAYPIEKWTKQPATRFKAPSLKEMAGMDSAALANALTLGNVGYSKDINTGKMSYTGTEYDDLASKIFDARPAKIPLNLNLANGGLADLYRYGGFI